MLDRESINPIKSNVVRVKHETQTILFMLCINVFIILNS